MGLIYLTHACIHARAPSINITFSCHLCTYLVCYAYDWTNPHRGCSMHKRAKYELLSHITRPASKEWRCPVHEPNSELSLAVDVSAVSSCQNQLTIIYLPYVGGKNCQLRDRYSQHLLKVCRQSFLHWFFTSSTSLVHSRLLEGMVWNLTLLVGFLLSILNSLHVYHLP